jgi:hypothetical protein
MIEFHYCPTTYNFTGICKITYDKSIRHYKNGKPHREDDAAYKYSNGDKFFYYNGDYYGSNNDFTIETWIKKVKELKYLESLEIFK